MEGTKEGDYQVDTLEVASSDLEEIAQEYNSQEVPNQEGKLVEHHTNLVVDHIQAGKLEVIDQEDKLVVLDQEDKLVVGPKDIGLDCLDIIP